jgi:hypothetical protein
MRFIKLNICFALSCCLFTVCSNDEQKWEPEMAVPLAFFEVDVSQYLRIDTFTINFFSSIPSALQTITLVKAIESLDSLDKSAKNGLPSRLRSEMDDFFLDIPIKRQPEALLTDLLNTFRDNQHFFAINNFAYEIVAEALRKDSKLKPKFEEMFAGDSVNFNNAVVIDPGEFSKNIGQIQGIELQLDVQSQLDVNADVQIVMLGSADNSPLDNFKVSLPIYGENKNSPQPHVYERDEARSIIQRLNEVGLNVHSKKLGLT